MYFRECTAAAAVLVIRDILENADSDRAALTLIRLWMDDQITADEIAESYDD